MNAATASPGEADPTAAAKPLFAAFAHRAANTGAELFALVVLLGVTVQPAVEALGGPAGALPVATALAVAAYFAGFWTSPMAATPFQRLGGLTVRDYRGRTLSVGRAVLRVVILASLVVLAMWIMSTPADPAAWLVAAPAWTALAMAAVTRRRQALHDLLTGSVVLYRKALAAQPEGEALEAVLRAGRPLREGPRWRTLGGLVRDVLTVAVPVVVITNAAHIAHDRLLYARVAYALQQTRAMQSAVEVFRFENGRLPQDAGEIGFDARNAYPDGGYYTLEEGARVVIRFTVLADLEPLTLTLTPKIEEDRVIWSCVAQGYRSKAHVPGACRP